MGCNCGKRKPAPPPPPIPRTASSSAYTLTSNGSTQTFGSRLEAAAAKVRNGNLGTVQRVIL